MKSVPSVFMLLLLPGLLLADQAYQTDWSGGPGIWGPVTSWGNSFYQASTGITWSSSGSLTLLTPEFDTVDGNFQGAYAVYAADIDGDGKTDALGAAHIADDITWWRNTNGLGTTWIKHTIDSNFEWATSVYAEDVDGDGDMDVLGAARVADDITWWENANGSGTSWTEHTVYANFNGAMSVYAQDMDGDGDMDVLGAAFTADDITWWENTNGSGTFWVGHSVDGQFNGAASVYAEDMDDDGDMDVLGAAFNADDIVWWENYNVWGTSWVKHTIDGSFDGACSVVAEDIDGDGDMDVLGGAQNAGMVSWWENLNGSGTSWSEHQVVSGLDDVTSVYAADIEGDGDIDVMAAASLADVVAWWENTDGSGTAWTEYVVTSDFNDARYVHSGDFNADGDMDIIAAAGADNAIRWWDVAGRAMEGSLESSVLDTGTSPNWDYFEWSAFIPPSSSVGFQIRASGSSSDMGEWSDTLYSPCPLNGIIDDGDRYMQYRAIFSTSDSDTAPLLYDVSVLWDPTGTGGSPPVTGYFLGAVEPNPAHGAVSISFGVPEPSSVDLSVFDLSGRLVSRTASGEVAPGLHEEVLGILPPGVYFCRMVSGDFNDTRRFAVID